MTTRRNILMASLILNIFFSQKIMGNGLSDGIISSKLTNPSEAAQPLDDQNTREQQAQDSFRQSSQGATVAGVLGAALLATGIPMIMSLDPVVAAAGVDLMYKGGLELEQWTANQDAATANNNQKQILNGADPFSLSPAAQNALNNPELDKALSDAGVNAEQFKQRLASGEFKSGADILAALGKPVDAETLAKGQQLADSKAAAIFADAKKKIEESTPKTITAEIEAKNKSVEGSESDSNSNSKSGRELASNEKNEMAQDIKSSVNPQEPKENHLATTPKDSDKKGTSSGFDMNSLLSKMFGSGSLMDSSDQKAVLRQVLGQMGIQLPVQGVSIFALAHRQYSEFGKSKGRAKRVALR
jgi:hypothetical protein